MRIEILRDVLLEGLNKITKVVSAKATQPILTGILMEVRDDEIILTGSDATESLRHCIPVDGDSVNVLETGSIVFPKQFADIVKKLRKNVSLSTEELQVTIKSGKSEFQLNCMDADEYPRLPNVNLDNPTIVFIGNQFKDFVKRTAFAASTSETRPILQGVLYNIQEGQLSLVSTDSHRLASVTHTVSDVSDNRLVVPAKSLDNALKVFDLNIDVEVFTENGNTLYIRNGQTQYQTRLLEGNYPDTSRLIPEQFQAIMKINRKEFINGLELINGIANAADDSSQGKAKLHVNGVASISSHQAQTGNKGMIEIPYVSLEGEDDFTISFSVKYVLDALKATESEDVEFKYTGSMRPFLLTPSDSSGFDELQLILPVRTY